MAKDYELFLTAGEMVPYVKYVAKGVKIFISIINFGKASEEQKAIEALQKYVRELKVEVDRLKEAVEKLNQEVLQMQNLARHRLMVGYRDEFDGLAFELKHSLKAEQLSVIAYKVALKLESMLADDDLWQWSDIGFKPFIPGKHNPAVKITVEKLRKLETREEKLRMLINQIQTTGDKVAVLLDAEFNVYPLPIFAAGLGVFYLAARLHQEQDSSAWNTYVARINRFREAITVRPSWIDLKSESISLPEKIRERLVVEGVATTKYAVNGKCEIDLYLLNRIEKTRTFVRTFNMTMASAGSNVLCTWSPSLGVLDERQLEEEYEPIKLLRVLERLLTPQPFIGVFPNETLHRLFLYAVEPSGHLRQFTCEIWTSLKEEPTWQQKGGEPIGTGWHNFTHIVAGDWNVLYAVKRDGSINWYRHDGANNNMPAWTGPRDVTPQRMIGTEKYVAGSNGTMYQIIRNSFGGGRGPLDIVRVTRQLGTHQHSAVLTGSGKFSKFSSISSDWPNYKVVFGAGKGVIYGIDDKNRLYWHKHTRDNTIKGPRLVGTGWGSFGHVFAIGHGFICGVYPSGEMLVYWLNQWSSDNPSPAKWHGPIRINGMNWNGFQNLVPMLDNPLPIVN